MEKNKLCPKIKCTIKKKKKKKKKDKNEISNKHNISQIVIAAAESVKIQDIPKNQLALMSPSQCMIQKMVYKLHSESIQDIKCVANESLILTASLDGLLKIVSVKKLKTVGILRGHTNFVRCIAVLNNKNVATGSHDESVRVWNLQTGQCIAFLQGAHTMGINALVAMKLHSKNDFLYLVSFGKDGKVVVWDWSQENQKIVKKLQNFYFSFYGVEVLDDYTVLTCNSNSSFMILNVQQEIFTTIQITNDQSSSTAYCIRKIANDRFVSGHQKDICLWKIDQTELSIKPVMQRRHIVQDWVRTICVSGHYFLTAGFDKQVRLWKSETLELITTIQSQQDWIWSGVFLHSKRLYITGDDRGCICARKLIYS